MKDAQTHLLIIGLFLSCGVGFLIGHFTAGNGPIVVRPQSSDDPKNWNPAQAIAEQAIKTANENSERCWTNVRELLAERVKAAQAPVGH